MKAMHRIGLIIICGLLVLPYRTMAAEDHPEWPGRVGRHVFEITRDGVAIGTQTITLERYGETLRVTTESVIAVQVLGIVIYRMRQSLTDTYRGKRLTELSAETQDPDGLQSGIITRNKNRWTGKNGNQTRDFECDCESSAMWHISSMKGTKMIDSRAGAPRSISIADLGAETLDLLAGRLQVRHFSVQGEIEREVWYDTMGNLVAAEQRGRDGSLIRQTLISASLRPAPGGS